MITEQNNDKELFLAPDNYSLPRILFEAYFTDEESFEPYTPVSSYTPETEKEETTEEETETEDTTEEEGEETEDSHYIKGKY